MRIECLDRIRATDDDGAPVKGEPKDQLTVGPNFGALACRMGWAKDLEGKVATGEKSTKPVTVSPANVIIE